MPIYEYVCNDCGYDFERMQSFKDEPLQTCPECQGNVRRVISSVGVIFKGSGWYITDSRRQLSGSKSSAGSRRQISDSKSDSDKPTTESTDTKKPSTSDGESKPSASEGGGPKDASDRSKDKKASTNGARSGANGGAKA